MGGVRQLLWSRMVQWWLESGAEVDDAGSPASGLWGPDCADSCCKLHDTCCGHSSDRRNCNKEIVACLKKCSPLGVTCLSEAKIPVPPAAIMTAMAIVENNCCG